MEQQREMSTTTLAATSPSTASAAFAREAAEAGV